MHRRRRRTLAGGEVQRLRCGGLGALEHEATGGVALDSAGDVYLSNAGDIAAFSPQGALIQRFGEGHLSGAGAVAVDSTSGEVFVLQPGSETQPGKILVFGPEGAGPPQIDGMQAQSLSPQLRAPECPDRSSRR